MKKILSLVVLTASAVSVLGQGTLFFQNSGATFLDASINRLVYRGEVGVDANRLVGTNYAAQLWYQRAGQTDLVPVAHSNAFKLFRNPNTTLPGAWNTAPGGATVVLDGIAISASTRLQVRVWDVSQFGTYADALARGGEVGQSDIFDYTVPLPGSLPATFALNGLRAFPIVPEPSTIVLGVLGVASLLLLRRRK
jgi:hypothetical protein